MKDTLHGFDAVGLEISAKGVSTAEEYAQKELQAPQAYFPWFVRNRKVRRLTGTRIFFLWPLAVIGLKMSSLYFSQTRETYYT
jgi:hypothetical protein